jgi:hypothetical protein
MDLFKPFPRTRPSRDLLDVIGTTRRNAVLGVCRMQLTRRSLTTEYWFFRGDRTDVRPYGTRRFNSSVQLSTTRTS